MSFLYSEENNFVLSRDLIIVRVAYRDIFYIHTDHWASVNNACDQKEEHWFHCRILFRSAPTSFTDLKAERNYSRKSPKVIKSSWHQNRTKISNCISISSWLSHSLGHSEIEPRNAAINQTLSKESYFLWGEVQIT